MRTAPQPALPSGDPPPCVLCSHPAAEWGGGKFYLGCLDHEEGACTLALAELDAHPPSDHPPSGSSWLAPAEPAVSPAIASAGVKADAGKLGTHLLPTRPLEAIARVLDFGAQKYAPNNWRKGIAYTRVYGAVLRHLWAWWRGETVDAESGQPHLACAMCELAFLLEYELSPDAERRGRCDDRPEAGAAKGAAR